ncbi:hypothetical protein MRB53_032326 [Persea americana]|uniref:Uncharacterized protein n=1 Tax=Persea americana TaxID=3435 RepID=A0ACC2KSH3_PERAE|nr:hypothetical protein MRB53_032326 [Persea americana]
MKISSLAIIFCYVLLLGSMGSVFSKENAAFPSVSSPPDIDAMLKDLDGWGEIVNQTLSKATIFIPTDVPKELVRGVNSTVIKYHVVPYAFSFFHLKQFDNGTRFPTLMHNKSILITSNDGTNFTIDGSHISHPDLFYDGKNAVHGVSTLLNYNIYGGNAHVSLKPPLKIAPISPTSPPPSSLNPPVAPKPPHTTIPKIDAIFKDLHRWRNILDESKRATIFFPNTLSKKFLREVPSSVIKYHVLPYALSFFALQHFKNGTRFPTLMHNKSILITSNYGSDFTIDGRPISDPDMFYDGKHAIHGVPSLLNYRIYGGKANSPKSPPSSLNPPVAPKPPHTVAPTTAPSPHHVGPPTPRPSSSPSPPPNVAAPSPHPSSSNPSVVPAPSPSSHNAPTFVPASPPSSRNPTGAPTSPHVAVVPAPSPLSRRAGAPTPQPSSSNPAVVHAATPSANHSDAPRSATQFSIILLVAVSGFFAFNLHG